MKPPPLAAALTIGIALIVIPTLYQLRENSDKEAVISNFLPVAGSAIVGAVIAVHLATRSSQELKDEAGKLRRESEESRRLTTLVLRGLEDGGVLTLNRDAQGNIVGLVMHGSGSARSSSNASARATVTRADGSIDS